MEQERLLIEAAQKDPDRFAELYEANFERIYAFIVRRVQDREASEDLTAEVSQHWLPNLSRFAWRGVPVAGWLFRIGAKAIADRRRKARQTVDPGMAEDLHQSSWREIERRATLFQLVNSLPEDQRSVLVKRFVEQKAVRDIAKELGRSEGAIKQLQFRALKSLKARVGGGHE